MTLSAVVTARVSDKRLKNLTNPDAQSASTVDATRLTAACDDAEGEFEVYVGTPFDETDARHVTPAVDLVVLILQERGAAPVDNLGAQREKIVERLKALALVTGRNRIMPLTVAEDRGAFDSRVFDNTTVDPQVDDEDDDE